MINLTINTQPNDETCGPTCLHSIYRYYGLKDSHENVINSVERFARGRTLAALLGKDALLRGLKATMYINNLDVFDPTWFVNGESNSEELITKLETQMIYKQNEGLVQSSRAYIDYLHLGGIIRFKTIRVNVLQYYFKQKIPILTGLSATYLYCSARECCDKNGVSFYDDIKGIPCGHFVVLCGYDEYNRHIVVADPYRENPLSHNNYYKVSSRRLINAIMLGVLTYDANLLIIQP